MFREARGFGNPVLDEVFTHNDHLKHRMRVK